MAKEPRIGVVTVTFNSGQVIDAFINSVLNQDHPNFCLFVIDNASKDDTLARLGACPDVRIQLIPNAQNLGVAEGNNQGIESALADGCEYILLLNNDVEFGPTLFSELVNGIEVHGCGLVVPKIYFHDDPMRIWCAGGAFHRWRGYATQHFGEGVLDIGQFNEPRSVEYCPTCCMLIKSEVFHTIGMMDKKYFVYWDDADFCYRALKSKLILYYIPTAKLWHKVSSLTGGNRSNFSFRYYTRNKIYFLLKNRPLPEAMFHLLFYYMYLTLALILNIGSWEINKTRQRAFFEGLFLYRRA